MGTASLRLSSDIAIVVGFSQYDTVDPVAEIEEKLLVVVRTGAYWSVVCASVFADQNILAMRM